MEEHSKSLKVVLDRLKEGGLRTKKKNCDFLVDHVDYTLHILHNWPTQIEPVCASQGLGGVLIVKETVLSFVMYSNVVSQIDTDVGRLYGQILPVMNEAVGRNTNTDMIIRRKCPRGKQKQRLSISHHELSDIRATPYCSLHKQADRSQTLHILHNWPTQIEPVCASQGLGGVLIVKETVLSFVMYSNVVSQIDTDVGRLYGQTLPVMNEAVGRNTNTDMIIRRKCPRGKQKQRLSISHHELSDIRATPYCSLHKQADRSQVMAQHKSTLVSTVAAVEELLDDEFAAVEELLDDGNNWCSRLELCPVWSSKSDSDATCVAATTIRVSESTKYSCQRGAMSVSEFTSPTRLFRMTTQTLHAILGNAFMRHPGLPWYAQSVLMEFWSWLRINLQVIVICGERQPLTDKNKTDPGNLGKSLDPVYQSVKSVKLTQTDLHATQPA
ncbi:hypothetical protein T265_14727, partial [Opisthorchis viverrini]